jgi:DNA-binding phage protein
MRQQEIALNAALKTADAKTVCAALEELVRSSPNVSKLAHDARIDRSRIYRTFRGNKGPRLAVVINLLRAAGFRLIVKFERQPKKAKPNHFGQGSKTPPISNFVGIRKPVLNSSHSLLKHPTSEKS